MGHGVTGDFDKARDLPPALTEQEGEFITRIAEEHRADIENSDPDYPTEVGDAAAVACAAIEYILIHTPQVFSEGKGERHEIIEKMARAMFSSEQDHPEGSIQDHPEGSIQDHPEGSIEAIAVAAYEAMWGDFDNFSHGVEPGIAALDKDLRAFDHL